MAVPAVVFHFCHPKHELKLREYHLPRVCKLCMEKLTGSGYSCHHLLCEVDLHKECAMYPETLLRSSSSSAPAHHPCHHHDLTLTHAGDGGLRRRVCDLCREKVPAGVFLYRCAPCGFHVHPRCCRRRRPAAAERRSRRWVKSWA